MAHLGEVGFLGGRPTVNPEGRLRGGCDATPPPARRIPDPSAKQGYLILQAQSKNDGARVGSKRHRGFLAYFRTVCVDEGSACAQAMQSGERIILATAYFAKGQVEKALKTQERAMALAKDTLLETGRSIKDRLEQYKKAAKK